MKKLLFYFVMLFCVAVASLTSCRPEEWEYKDPSGDGMHGALTESKPVEPDSVIVNRDSLVYVHDTVPRDSIVITVHDTVRVITHDTIRPENPETVTLDYSLSSNKTDNLFNFLDVQPTSLKVTKSNGVSEIALSTDVNRSGKIGNNSDTMFVAKVDELKSYVSLPTTKPSSYDVRGEYDINTAYRDYNISLSDGAEYQVNTEAESASGMYEGVKRDLLYRMVQGIKVISVEDEMTNDTIVKDGMVYRKVNRIMMVEIKSLNRPLMGPEIVTFDTLIIESAAASKSNGIAAVYVEDRKIPGDTIPVIPGDTVPVVPEDTIPVVPEDTIPVGPEDTIPAGPGDPGYKYGDEEIESIDFSYTIDPNAGILREVLLVRFSSSYVMPVVSKTMLTPVKVANPSYYNSVVWYSNSWTPAYLAIQTEGFVWRLGDNTVGESATDETINWLANTTGISKISRSDFLKHATFVNEGNTTRVYVDNNYYMTLK